MWSTAEFVWVPAIKIIFIRAVTLLSVLQVISLASDHTRLGFVSTSFQGSVHSVLQHFTCNSKEPRVLVFPGEEMWRNKTRGWHVEETERRNLCTPSESLSRWALQHTLLLKPMFRQSPDISNRQNVGRGLPGWLTCWCHFMPARTMYLLQMQKQVWDGFWDKHISGMLPTSSVFVIVMLPEAPKSKEESSTQENLPCRVWGWSLEHFYFYHLYLTLSFPSWSFLTPK